MYLGRLREQLNVIWFKLDEAQKDTEKALIRPIGQKVNYLPSRDINGHYINSLVYGAAAGLNREAADVRLMQFAGPGIISQDTVRENVDFIVDPRAEGAKVAQERTEAALTQKLFQEGAIQDLQFLLDAQAKGKTMSEALVELSAQQQAQTPAAPPEGAPSPEGVPGPSEASGEQQALEAGGIPEGGGGIATEPPAQPLTNILVAPQHPGRAFTQTGGAG
jgi:hypothetical protein